MSNMISELKAIGHEMTNEQQVQAMIRSLPSNWEHMYVNLTHNDNIKTCDDVARHVELEEDRRLIEKHVQEAFMTENKLRGAQGFGCNKGKVRVLKEKEEMKPIIVNQSVSVGNAVARKARTRIVLRVVCFFRL